MQIRTVLRFEMLNESDVINVYKLKLKLSVSTKGESEPVSKLFGISARAVRDIWNRKTWTYATRHLWACEDSSAQGDCSTEPSSEVNLTVISR